MALQVRRVQYFHMGVDDQPGEAYKLLSRLASLGVNLLAFHAVPTGPDLTQLTLFPEDAASMLATAQKAGLVLDGPHSALLAQGDDELGSFARIHEKLYGANVNVYASTGVVDGRGLFGYVLYIRPDEFDNAAMALGV